MNARRRLPVAWTVGLTLLVGPGGLFGEDLPSYYTVPDITLSPDRRYGVTVPELGGDKVLENPQNKVIEVKTGKVLGVIQTDDVAYAHINNGEIVPTGWSADGSILLWQVDAKWGYGTEILIQQKDGKIQRQTDILKLLRQEVLQRTRKAVPEKYEVVKKTGERDGSWWQDGFAIDCVLQSKDGPLTFPLRYEVFLTSNPKDNLDSAHIDARMTAEIMRDGSVKIDEFYLGSNPPARNW